MTGKTNNLIRIWAVTYKEKAKPIKQDWIYVYYEAVDIKDLQSIIDKELALFAEIGLTVEVSRIELYCIAMSKGKQAFSKETFDPEGDKKTNEAVKNINPVV